MQLSRGHAAIAKKQTPLMSRFALTTTDRLMLRAPTEADADAMFAIYSDAATQVFNPMGAMNSKDAAAHMLARWQLHWHRHGFGTWVVCRADAPHAVLGFGGVQWNADETALNLHVHLCADAAGRGFATEIGLAALALAADLPEQPAIQAAVPAGHGAALACLKKLGFAAAGECKSLPWLAARKLFRLDMNRPALRQAGRALCAGGQQARVACLA